MDTVFNSWLERQYRDVQALAAASDVLRIACETDARPPRRFIAQFDCPTMVGNAQNVTRVQGFAVHFEFPSEYLRVPVEVGRLINLLAPRVFHPNVSHPFVCIGPVAPGTSLLELIYRVYEILSFQKFTPREDNALNHDACVWTRRHLDLLPLSRAPLKRRVSTFSVTEIRRGGSEHEAPGN